MKTQEKVKQTYNIIAEEFSNTRTQAWANFHKILPHLQDGMSVLDLGCGNGRLYEFLKANSRIEYTGLDQASKFLDIAREKYPEALFVEHDMSHSLPDKKYDILIAMASFHHIPPQDQSACLTLWKKHLKSEGKIIFINWNLFQTRFWKAWLSPKRSSFRGLEIPWAKRGTRYYYAHSPSSMRKLLENQGFRVLENHFLHKDKRAPFYKADNLWTLASL